MIKLIRNQKGFTLVELLIVIGITGIISVVAAMSVSQVFTGTIFSNNQNTAINQVRNAVYRISRDAQSANPSSIDVATNFLSLERLEWESGNWTSHAITYTYTLEEKELRRSYDGSTPGILIAQYIEPASHCTWNTTETILTVTITAQVGDETETRTFEVKPRPDAPE